MYIITKFHGRDSKEVQKEKFIISW